VEEVQQKLIIDQVVVVVREVIVLHFLVEQKFHWQLVQLQ
jgi:hypothetical protein